MQFIITTADGSPALRVEARSLSDARCWGRANVKGFGDATPRDLVSEKSAATPLDKLPYRIIDAGGRASRNATGGANVAAVESRTGRFIVRNTKGESIAIAEADTLADVNLWGPKHIPDFGDAAPIDRVAGATGRLAERFAGWLGVPPEAAQAAAEGRDSRLPLVHVPKCLDRDRSGALGAGFRRAFGMNEAQAAAAARGRRR